MANYYYDFNPSATTWALMLSGVVLFTVALCVVLIVAISRIEASSVTVRTEAPEVDRADEATLPAASQAGTGSEQLARPAARAPRARPA
ncbi:hypothetical protein [Nocardioides pocheonensis]|uniref:Uncharacterized protein n=1 Tax=Nocardioides pocheonensis TaxID=661485 RepID=A0A3N0GF55_9ACTN|nr:hypothetical protein [Nocardioides pocheonensis]RNM11094.1 hypothetical protein EFL26_23385 [Nocardioides pocheonensis]